MISIVMKYASSGLDRIKETFDLFGVVYYTPEVEEIRVVNRKKVTKSVPLYPGYLFVVLGHEEHAMQLKRRYNLACSPMTHDGTFVYTRPGELSVTDAVRSDRVAKMLVKAKPVPGDGVVMTLQPGDNVKFHRGVMSGHFGTVTALKEDGYLVDVDGYGFPMVVPPNYLKFCA